jgi:hypothetical protein
MFGLSNVLQGLQSTYQDVFITTSIESMLGLIQEMLILLQFGFH